MSQSDNIKNGQLVKLQSGAGAINSLDLVQAGGPGNQLWSVAVADRAAIPGVSTVAPASIVAGAVNNYAHWPTAIDKLGNTYVLTPNVSGQGVNASKYSPLGVSLIANLALDATASAMINMKLVALSNGTFAAVYVQASTGAIKFLIVDTNLLLVAAPTAVATGYTTGSVAYIDACALSAGGFAVVYQNSAHTAMVLQTYSNTGTTVQAATSVQTITGAALVAVKIGQLSTGNLVIVMRTTAAPAGTSFVIVSTSGVSVVANTPVDSTATAGFCELNILPTTFAVADANGTNLIVNVYNNSSALQNGGYSIANTLNSAVYSQLKLTNDGVNFWYFAVSSSGGLICGGFSAGGTLIAVTPSVLESGFVPSTAAIDACISNGIAFALVASTTTGGQSYFTIGLPNTANGSVYPFVLSAPVTLGNAAATTGSYWPSCRALGDFSAAVVYDQQSTPGVFFGQVKFAASSIQGIAQNAVAAGSPGTLMSVNPGPGSYPVNQLAGTVGVAFDHRSVGGLVGVMLGAGVTLGSVTASSSGVIVPSATNPVSGTFGSGRVAIISTSNATWAVPAPNIRVRVWGGGSTGGGGFAMKVISGLTVGSTIPLTVGAAGGALSGGGSSSVGSYCSATGGANGGVGGIGSGGDINYSGGSTANGACGGAANIFGPGGNGGQSGASGGGGSGGGSGFIAGNGGGSGGSGVAGNGGSGGSAPTSGGVPTVGLSASSSVTGFSLDYIGAGGGGGGGGNGGGSSNASGASGGSGENGGGGGGPGTSSNGSGSFGNGGFPGGGGQIGATGLIIIEW